MKPALIPVKNLISRKGRSVLLLIISMLLVLALFCGSALTLALSRGLDNLESRLGADIIVLPASARSKVDVKNLYLQGTKGYYYMDAALTDKIAAVSGVEKVSAQVFLASLRAECCSAAVQVIGFDPDTDFTIQPWIARRSSAKLGLNQLIVGSDVGTGVGEILRIYNVPCEVIARLDETGTDIDTGVYCTMETMSGLLNAARELGHELKISGDPEKVVSAVYVKLSQGTDVTKALVELSHIRGISAVETKSVISSVSDSLNAVSATLQRLVIAICALMFVLMASAFALQAGSRRADFAALRVIGFSRKMLVKQMLIEALIISFAGGILGALTGILCVTSFSQLIEDALGLPYLTPEGGTLAILGLICLIAVCALGSLASAFGAAKLSRVNAADMLREGS